MCRELAVMKSLSKAAITSSHHDLSGHCACQTHNGQNVSDVVDIHLCVAFAELLQRVSEPSQSKLLHLLPTPYIFSAHQLNDSTRQCQTDENVERAQQHEIVARYQIAKTHCRDGDEGEIEAIEKRPAVFPLVEDGCTGRKIDGKKDECTQHVEELSSFHFLTNFAGLAALLSCGKLICRCF